MIIEHNLLKKQKSRKYSSKVEVDLYETATELYEELDSKGIIDRIKDVPQLGVINVSKNLKKSRYDYTVLQLYFHQLIKNNLQDHLEPTYNNYLKASDFRKGLNFITKKWKPSIADLLQVLAIVYNIGHFYNTFVSSRAMIIYATQCAEFRDLIIQSSDDALYQCAARKLLDEANYQRFHLINSLLILQKCDQTKQSVRLAQELLYAYINENTLSEDNKLHYVFWLFRSVRNVAYVSYDLQIAKTPLTIDLCNPNALLVLFKELLSAYNDSQSTKQLVDSISKLLDDTVYNEESHAICYYMISQRMVSKLRQIPSWSEENYYHDYWICKDSLFNSVYSQRKDYVKTGILKLTFAENQNEYSRQLFNILNHTNGVRAGYYDRHHGEQTILVSLKRSCKTKPQVAFRILKIVVSSLRRIPDVDATDPRYLLATKFFLLYLFRENPVIIKPTIHPEVCVICTKGKRQRISALQKLLISGYGNADERHEAENICSILRNDERNDTCIIVPASILAYAKEKSGKKLCEFDGVILFPTRKQKSIVFLEAKNTKDKPAFGKVCLTEKLVKLNIPFNEDDIQIQGKDAVLYYEMTGE